jgi:V/A-type H+-transporting ATPase subunit A
LGRVLKLAGSIAVVELDTSLGELIFLGEENLLGEVLRVEGKTAIVQAFDDLTGVKPGEPAKNTGNLLEFELGPGMLNGVFDGLQRNLVPKGDELFLKRGKGLGGLEQKPWNFKPIVKKGDDIVPGQAIGVVTEGPIQHRILAQLQKPGKVDEIYDGKYKPRDTVAIIGGKEITMSHRWPVRKPRPGARLVPEDLFITGQRVIDTLFPLAMGGSGLVPGGFGTGKTQLLFQFVKHAPVEVVVYVGCGERGNEIIQLMHELQELKKGEMKLIERTIFLANTSNMPVAARSASIFAGITVAEYFRDQGKHVVCVVDSLTRWAEAEREVASRMGIMPGEGGYPPYMSTQLAEFFERSGMVETPQGPGSVTLVASVSPTGGDITEPVTQAAMKTAGSILVLNNKLAYQRHYPAIDWIKSFSNYKHKHQAIRLEMLRILAQASDLERLAGIVGIENLTTDQRLLLWYSEVLKEGFLRQSAFHPIDKFCPHEDQIKIVEMLVNFYKYSRKKMIIPEELFEELVAAKFLRGDELSKHTKKVLSHVEA